MARKKGKIKAGQERWYEHFDWSVDPQTSKEILAILALALGLLFLFSIFGSGGEFGRQTLTLLSALFGLAGFVVPFAFLTIAWVLWKTRELKVKGPSVIGLILLFIFTPALFLGSGGAIGQGISTFFINLFGSVAGFLILLALAVASILLATNISISQTKQWLWGEGEPEESPEPRVSVFQTVKNKLAGRNGQATVRSSAEAPAPSAPKTYDRNWTLPPLELLPTSTTKAASGNIAKNVEIIQKTLKDFGISVAMGDVHIGPTVTQYTLKPAEGVKLTGITARGSDLALALAAHPIRIEAPIPGKAYVGIEIPNKQSAVVTLREIIESEKFKVFRSNLRLALGRDVAGAPFVADLKKMPHLLIAGSTGAGKSVALGGIILSLLFQNSPADLRILLIDPKRVEFTLYNGIPHLLTSVITEIDKTINSLRWAVAEMERRFKLFAASHKRNIDEYNANPSDGHLPYIVVIIDELADLMAQAANEAEAAIVRLAQLARATGIHLVVATQRPSVDVITGLIKANITTRIAFAVASQVDSRTIIDQAGADKLLGNGDMLYLSPEIGKPKRVQGVLVGEREIKTVGDFLRSQAEAVYDDSVQEYRGGTRVGARGEGAIDDDLFGEAKQTVVAAGKASASLLQRRLRVGYARAARLLDLLEQEDIIGPPDGSKPRDVLITPDMLDYESSASNQPSPAPPFPDQPAPPSPHPSQSQNIDYDENK